MGHHKLSVLPGTSSGGHKKSVASQAPPSAQNVSDV